MKPNQNQTPTNSAAPSAPTNSAAPVPPAPEADAKAKAEADAKAKVEFPARILAGLRDALGQALRVMITNQFSPTDGGRLTAENAFEKAKNIPPTKVSRQDLADALTALTTATNHLANHSLRFPGDLDALREKLRTLNKLAEQYDALLETKA